MKAVYLSIILTVVIFGQNEEDLIKNARFAQVMYNSNYQGFTPPTTPMVADSSKSSSINERFFGEDDDIPRTILMWNTSPDYSRDVVTGYSDFEGYKIYKSTDAGQSWGGPEDKIYDSNGDPDGWNPYAQFDLSAYEDSIFCVKGIDKTMIGGSSQSYLSWLECVESEDNPSDCCTDNLIRGIAINGEDPYAPWYNLGEDTGLNITYTEESGKYEFRYDETTGKYAFIDTDIVNGYEYTYSVTAYDMGVSGANPSPNDDGTIDTLYIANPDQWASPDGYQSIENSKGTTAHDNNYIVVVPGHARECNAREVIVVPNPYIKWSGYEEEDYRRVLRFTRLPEKCTITIYTVSGEKVNTLEHDSVDGAEEWNLRTVNNQEVAPGLYIYSVEPHSTWSYICNTNEECYNSEDECDDECIGECNAATPDNEAFVGKFAVIR